MINSPNLHILSTYSSSSGSCCSAELSIYFIMLNVHISIADLSRMENCKNIIWQIEHMHLYPNTMFKLKYILGELYFLNWLQLYIFLSYILRSGSLHITYHRVCSKSYSSDTTICLPFRSTGVYPWFLVELTLLDLYFSV